MKKFLPIIIIGFIVLLLRLPSSILKKQVDEKFNDPSFLNKLEYYIDSLNTKEKENKFLEYSTQDSIQKRYIDHKFGFEIVLPENWEIKKAITNENIIVKAIHKIEDHRYAGIIIYAWKFESPSFFDELSAEELFNLTYSDRAELISYGIDKLDSKKSIWLEMKINNIGLPSYALCYSFVQNEILFSLFGNTVLGDYTWFKQNEQIFLKSFKTFKFVK